MNTESFLKVVFIRNGITYRDKIPNTTTTKFETYNPRNEEMLIGLDANNKMTSGGWLKSEIVSWSIEQ